jgi:hypothetical protein|tara:strand:+ start:214 stop:1248 length:1035 start_codon:yes stop_codon:yes gene_type:complete
MANEMNIPPCRPKDIIPEIIDNTRAGLSTFIWGAPGVGKSQIVKEVAKQLNRSLMDFRSNLFDPVDVRGIPFHESIEGTHMTYWAPPSIFPYEHRDAPEGIFFLDELTTAPQATQNAFLQLVLDGKVGDYTLPPGWVCIGAGNRLSDLAAVYDMTAPMKNRFSQYHLDVNLDDWCDWAAQNGITDLITSFIRFRPNLLFSFDSADSAFPTPRSWEMLNKKLQFNDNTETDRFFQGVASLIGSGPAGEFVTFKLNRDKMPDIDALLRQPHAAKVPKDEPAIMYAIAGAIAARSTPENFDKVCQYANRMEPEFQVVLMRDALSRNSSLAKTNAYQSWLAKNATEII